MGNFFFLIAIFMNMMQQDILSFVSTLFVNLFYSVLPTTFILYTEKLFSHSVLLNGQRKNHYQNDAKRVLWLVD